LRSCRRRGENQIARDITLLDLVAAVSRYARPERELIATLVSLVNSGKVRLCGSFRGVRFDLTEGGTTAAHRAVA